jgi:hypothetical protein
MLEKVALILGIITSLLAIWEGVARIAGKDGPVGIAQDIGDNSTTTDAHPPVITTNGKDLDKPAGVSLSGDCESGFTLTWQPVEGADSYRIERDGMYNGTERDTDHSIPAFPDEKQHSFRVFAEAFPDSRSEGSDEVVAEACSF